MKLEQIFIGDIKKCTKYERCPSRTYTTRFGVVTGVESEVTITYNEEVYKEKAVLIKIDKGGYVDLDRLNTIMDILKIHKDLLPNSYRVGGLMMATRAHKEGCLFVDENSLTPMYSQEVGQKETTAKQLKKELYKIK